MARVVLPTVVRAYIKKAVDRGAKLLDRTSPNWHIAFIGNATEHGLDISNGANCVLGNVFRDKAAQINREARAADPYSYDKNGYDVGYEQFGFSEHGTSDAAHGFNNVPDRVFPARVRHDHKTHQLANSFIEEEWLRVASARLHKMTVKSIHGGREIRVC